MQLLETIKRPQILKEETNETEILIFPKVCQSHPNNSNITCLQEFMMRCGDNLVSDLRMQGALLFRDFDIQSPNESVALLKQLGFVDFSSSQNKLSIAVGTKQKQLLNTEPLTMFACQPTTGVQHANIHNQFCETVECPEFVALYCLRPAAKGGNISLINWKKLCDYVNQKHPEFLKDIKQKGVAEITVLSEYENPEQNSGNGWKNSFKVANKEEAQKMFKQNNYQFQWLHNENNDVRLRKIKKGTGLYNILNQILSIYKACPKNKGDFDKMISFGNGDCIPKDVLSDISQSSLKFISEVELKQCDLLIMNYSTIKYIHCPYEGPDELRKIFVSFMKYQKQKNKSNQLYQILNSGYKLPLIGFGTWKIKKEQAEEVVYNAIKCGYRLIDCAPVYQNQVEVGKGIKKAIDQKIVKREHLFITSKLWNTNHKPQNVRPACERTLQDLGLQYLDLYLMHFPVSLKFIPPQQNRYPEWIYDTKSSKKYILDERVPVTETWKAMEDLVVAGLVRNIGLSNFTVALTRQLMYTCQIKPAVLQTQIHPELNESKLIRFSRQEGIQITSYSSFGASSYFEIGFTKQDQRPIFQNQKIKEIAKKHDRTPHQVILRWAIQQGLAIIPKTVKLQRMKQNVDIVEFSLESEDMREIKQLHKGRRYNDPGQFCLKEFGTFYPLHE